MAIKEFIIGPQNYFEEGYFDGDYTLPNVSKAFLECDIDNIKGGRVVTGLYYLDNYIDGTYYHDNSIRAFMTVEAMVVQEATVSLQGYINDNYYQAGYYQTRGSIFTLVADIEKVAQTVEASGTISSQFTQSITVGRIRQAQSQVNASFTQTAFVEKLKEINLFAFTEAAIQVAIEVTRQANIDLATQFDLATDGRRFRDLDADSDSEFDFDLVNQRSREFNIETQTAFLLAIDNDRLRYYTSSQTVSSALACTISHIESADIVVSNFATLSATIDDRLRDQSAALSSQFTATTVNSRIRFPQASLIANSFQTTDPSRVRFGVLNASLVSTLSAQVIYYKGIALTNLPTALTVSASAIENIRPYDPADYTMPMYRSTNISFQWQFPRNIAGSGDELIDVVFVSNIKGSLPYIIQVAYNNSQGDDTIFVSLGYLQRIGVDQYQERFYENQYTILASTTNGLSTNTWRDFSISATVSTTGVVSLSATFPVAFSQLTPGRQSLGDTYNIAITGNPSYAIPEITDQFFAPNTIRNISYTPSIFVGNWINLPKVASADLINLNFGTLTADVLSVVFGSLTMFNQASMNTQASRTRQFSSSLNSDFQRLFIVTKVVEGATSISAATTLTVLNTLARLAQSAMLANFAQSATALRTRTSTAGLSAVTTTTIEATTVGSARTDLTVTATMSVQGDRIRFGQPQLDSIATTLAVVFRNATGTVTLESDTVLSVDAVKTSDQAQQISAVFTASVDIIRSRDNSSDANSLFDLTILADRRKAAGSEMIAESDITINTDLSLTRTTSADLQANGAVLSATEDSLTRTSSADLTLSTQLICINDRFKLATATITSVASIQLFTTKVVRITAVLVSQGFVLSDNDILNIDPFRQLKVAQETRFEPVSAESRMFSVDSETRVNNLI